MTRAVLCAALFAVFAPALPHAAPLPDRLASIMAQPQYAGASFGAAIYDLDSKRFIYTHAAERYFQAASTTKLLTEGTSLAVLGTQYRFHTNVYRDGPVDARGVLHGDLVLRASGDPNLSGRLRPGGSLAFQNDDHSYDGGPDARAVSGDPLAVLRQLSAQVAARGIKRVTGRVIVDDTLYPGGFAEAGTGAVVSPVMLNDNIVDVVVSAGAKPGDPVSFTVSPRTPYARFQNRARTGAPGSARSIALQDGDADQAGAQRVRVTGSIPAGSPPVLYAYDVPSPRRFAEMAFTQTLRQRGVAVAQSAIDRLPSARELRPFYAPGNVLATHLSTPLAQDVKVTLKVSDNLHADTMPYLWANGDLKRAYAIERAFIARGGLDPRGMVQSDGLGTDAFVQPAFMARYLAYVARLPFFGVFERALPVLGVDGTLFDVQRRSPARGKVFAKTGTWSVPDALNGRDLITAKGLAGYMTTRSGRHLAFAFYVNDLAASGNADPERVAADVLGEMAAATYLWTR